MTEEINGQGSRPTDTAGTRRSDAAKPPGGRGENRTEAAGKPSSADKVSITPSGLLIAKLEEIVQGTPTACSSSSATFSASP